VPRGERQSIQPTVGRWCVAVLLIGFLLYNPFLALMSHSNGLSYQAMARHRATVGASELQHYSPVPGENAQLDAIIEVVFAGCQAENHKYPNCRPQDETLAQRMELIASMWFRPPPAR
jgi:hypothetical protein